MSKPNPKPHGALSLIKLHSWSPGTAHNEESWRRRRRCHLRRRLSHCQSVTDDDVDELRAWFELGFTFDSPGLDPKLADTFPALEIYRAVNKPLGRSMSMPSAEVGTVVGGATKALDPGEDPKVVKARLKQWAQVVACVVQQQSKSEVKMFPFSN